MRNKDITQIAKSFDAILKMNINTKLNKIITLNTKKIQPFLEKLNYAIEDTEIEFASIDSRGDLIVTDNRYSYTKENQKLRMAKLREVYDVEIGKIEFIYPDEELTVLLPESVVAFFEELREV